MLLSQKPGSEGEAGAEAELARTSKNSLKEL